MIPPKVKNSIGALCIIALSGWGVWVQTHEIEPVITAVLGAVITWSGVRRVQDA